PRRHGSTSAVTRGPAAADEASAATAMTKTHARTSRDHAMMEAVGGPLPAATTYRLHQRVGRGGMADVYLGSMLGPAGERRVAIKRLVADDALAEDARHRLIDEARLVFQLTHANICQVFDLATSADGAFVVMEFV